MEKKNTILLTVIAIATLLVAMVGATFAYFTAQRGEGAQAEITVKTSTSDSLEMGTFSPIDIYATQDNFGENKGTRSGTSDGEISLKANDAEATETVSYCYTTDFYVESNNFVYSKPEGTVKASNVDGDNDPELVLTITKIPASTVNEENDAGTPYVYTDDLSQAADEGDDDPVTLKYNEDIYTTSVCENDNEIVADSDETSCQNMQIKGYDITTLKSLTTINIPVSGQEEKPLVHKITAPKNTKVTDKWKATVYFVNYNYDQELNTGKYFHGQLKFTTVNCETGLPDTDNSEP